MNADTFNRIQAFYLSVLYNYPRPQIRWERGVNATGGSITLYVNSGDVLEVNAYSAVTLNKNRFKYFFNENHVTQNV